MIPYRPDARARTNLLTVLALVLLAGTTPAAAQMTLSEAARLTTEQDPSVTALRQEVASRTLGIQEARDEYYPSLSVSADSGSTDTDGPGLTLTVSQVLYDWGLIRSKIKSATQARVQAVADLKMTVEDLTLQISEAFLDVEVLERKLRLTRDYGTYAGRLAAQAENRARAGLGDNGEVARARLEIARARDRLASLTADRDMSLAQIEFLTGRPTPGVVPPPGLDFGGRYSNRTEVLAAVRVAPDYIAARARLGDAEANVQRVKASRLPTIQLQAQGRADLNGGRTRTSVGISAGVDLNASSIGGRGTQIAQKQLEAAQFSLQAVERQMSNTARTAIQQIGALQSTERSRVEQLQQAQRVLENYEKQFVAGQRELIDVLTTGRDLYDAQIDQVDTYDERKRTEYQAARDLGVLGTLILETSGMN